MGIVLKVNDDLALDVIQETFLNEGRAHVKNFMDEECAVDLYNSVVQFKDWNRVLLQEGKHFDISPNQIEAMSSEQHLAIQNAAYCEAQKGFAYLYDNYSIYDSFHGQGCSQPFLEDIYHFVNGDNFLNFARKVTGFDDIAFADCQLQRYAPGQFLNTHDDGIYGKNRRAAYIIMLTPNWRQDWGGHLHFFDDEGHVEGGLVPKFNVINILNIPKPHAVSQVSTFAKGCRYSIIGWLRTSEEE